MRTFANRMGILHLAAVRRAMLLPLILAVLEAILGEPLLQHSAAHRGGEITAMLSEKGKAEVKPSWPREERASPGRRDVLVQREMENWRSPLASIPPSSATS